MSGYLDDTKDYIEKLRNSDICQRYFEQKEFVSKNYPDLKQQIDEYRRINFRLQNETDSDRLFDEIDRFEKEYDEFRKNPIVSDFLASELAFCRLFQEVQGKIGAFFALELDL